MLNTCTLQVIAADTQSYAGVTTLIDLVQPAIILLKKKQIAAPIGIHIREYMEAAGLNESELHAVHPKFFQEAAGLESVEHLSISALHGDELDRHALALEAVHALQHFLQSVQSVHLQPRTIRFIFQSPYSRMALPLSAIRALELLPIPGQQSASVFSSVNRCSTKEGVRLLRGTLVAPFKDLPTIQARLEAVQELCNDRSLLLRLSVLLKQLPDLDSSVSALVARPHTATPSSVRQLVHGMMGLKEGLGVMKDLADILASVKSPLLAAVRECLQAAELQSVLDVILANIDEEATVQKEAWLRQQEEVFAVRAGKDAMLDTTRVVFAQTLDDIDALVEQYRQAWGAPSLCTKYSKTRGYHLSLPVPQGSLPLAAIRVSKLKRAFVFTTQDLDSQNRSLTSLLHDMYLATNSALQAAREELLQFMWSLSAAIESVALLDVVHGFAQVANQSGQSWVRPCFVSSERAVLQLTAMRHPVAEALSLDQVSNDCFFGEFARTTIVTGPNGAGKSTFIRTAAINTILAHCGAFLPATEATMSVFDNILVRVGFDDDMHTNASTFSVEMRELAHILDHANENSLVIIDELGRGTAVDEGVSIAWAAVEALLESKCACLLVTHFHELASLAGLYASCTHLAMAAQPVGESIAFQFKASDPKDTTFIDDYGIRAARAMGCPDVVLNTALAVKQHLAARKGWSQGVLPSAAIPLEESGSIWTDSSTFRCAHAVDQCPIVQWLQSQLEPLGHRDTLSNAAAMTASVQQLQGLHGSIDCLRGHLDALKGYGAEPERSQPLSDAAREWPLAMHSPAPKPAAQATDHATIQPGVELAAIFSSPPLPFPQGSDGHSERGTVSSSIAWDFEAELSSIGDLSRSETAANDSMDDIARDPSSCAAHSMEHTAAAGLLQMFGGL